MSWFNVNRPSAGKPGRKDRSGKSGMGFFRAKEPRILPGQSNPPLDAQGSSGEERPPAQRPPETADENTFR